jgi:hypothetical protein
MTLNYIYDSLGELWIWDGRRVFHVRAEIEMLENGEDASENGYPASTIEEAEKWLD